MSKKNTSGGFVFSTDPNFRFSEPDEQADEPATDQQVLRIWLERVKGGKEATVIKGFVGPDDRLSELARTLKNKCAAGGNASLMTIGD